MSKPSLRDKILPPKPSEFAKYPTIDEEKFPFAAVTNALVDAFDEYCAKVEANIARLESEAAQVNGYKSGEHWCMTSLPASQYDTHRGWLIGVEPITRGVTKDELINGLRAAAFDEEHFELLHKLADRIEKEGLRNE